jgi:Uma2 family endonuclease
MLNEVKTMVALLMQRPITEQIAMEVKATEGFEHLEIEDGEWVGFDKDEFMGGEEHGWIESLLITYLTNWVLENNTGRVYPGDTDFVLSGTPDDIQLHRRPDIAYMRNSRVVKTKGYVYAVPDLTIEVVSPTEKPTAIRRKLREYLSNGVQQAWQVFPDDQEIVVNFPDGTAKTYGVGDTISGGSLLPGFSVDVTKVFQV